VVGQPAPHPYPRGPLVRDLDETRAYTLALASTDLTTSGEHLVARYASRWSIEQSIKDGKNLLGAATPRTVYSPPSNAPHPWDWRT
jgi:hypothetical protein